MTGECTGPHLRSDPPCPPSPPRTVSLIVPSVNNTPVPPQPYPPPSPLRYPLTRPLPLRPSSQPASLCSVCLSRRFILAVPLRCSCEGVPMSTLIIGGSCHKYNFCGDKIMFVATKYFRRYKTFVATNICCNKHVFVARKVLWRQAYFRRDKRRILSRQTRVVLSRQTRVVLSPQK